MRLPSPSLRAATLALLVAASPAHAGPWPAVPGAGFASVTLGAERSAAGVRPSGLVALYADYGLRPGIAFSAWAEGRSGAAVSSRAHAGLRWHPWGEERLVGLGAAVATRGGVAALRLETHAGRPIGRGAPGWARAGLALEAWGTGPEAELSLQAGLRPGSRAIVMLDLSAHHGPNGATRRAGLSAGWRLGGTSELVLGLSRATGAGAGDRVSLSLWRRF